MAVSISFSPAAEIAPATMARNKEGFVIGDLFQFDRAKLLAFADWIEEFSGTISGKSGDSKLFIDISSINSHRDEAVEALRDLGNLHTK